MAAAAILNFVEVKFDDGKLWVARVYFRTKFGEDILKGGQVMTIYVFLKWRPAAILDFQISEI